MNVWESETLFTGNLGYGADLVHVVLHCACVLLPYSPIGRLAACPFQVVGVRLLLST